MAWVMVFLWAALIFVLSSVPDLGTGLGIWDWVLRKGAHLTEYAVLAALLWRALRASAPSSTIRAVSRWTFALAVLYAISDEVHQSLVPTRVGTPIDVLIDAVGVAAGVVLWKRFRGCGRA